MAIRHLVEAALIFSKARTNEIDALLSGQLETYRQTLLWHWLLSDPAIAKPLVNKYVNWLVDETTATRLVSQNGYILKYLAPELRNQRAIVFAAIKSHPEAIADAPKSFNNDIELINYALANATEDPGKIIAFIGPELSSNPVLFRQLLITAVENSAFALSCDAITEYLEQNPEFYKKLLWLIIERKKDDFYPIYSDVCKKKLIDDNLLYRKLALSVLAQSSGGIDLVYFPDLNNDREVVATAVGSYPMALTHAARELQADRALVKEAVGHLGRTLQFASEELKNDKDIVLAAVKNDGIALKYASERLRADPIIVTAALKNNGRALCYVDEQFKHHPYYVRLAVSHPKHPLDTFLDKAQLGNKELLTIAVSKSAMNFRCANRELRGDEELAQLAVQVNGYLLQYVDSRLRDHEPTVRLAVQRDGVALMYASPELQANKKLVKLAVCNDGMALKFASHALKDCPEVVKLALQQNPLALQFASDNCRNNPELVNIALQNNGNALRYVGPSLQNKPEIIEAAIDNIGPVAVRYIQQFS